MTGALQVGLALAVVWLWLQVRPVMDPDKVRAGTPCRPLTDAELGRVWLTHAKVISARRQARRAWLRGLARHLAACEERWRHQGWNRPAGHVLPFHRKYAEEQR